MPARRRGLAQPGIETHGAYAFMRRYLKGTWDRRSSEAQAVKRLAGALAEDLGGWEGLTTGQRLLVDRIAVKTLVLGRIESYGLKEPVTEGGELRGLWGEHYLAYANSLRLDLQALGLRPVRGDENEGGLDAATMIQRAREREQEQDS